MSIPDILTHGGLFAFCLSVFLGIYIHARRPSSRGSAPFALLMLMNAVYAISYSLELKSGDLATAVFWFKMKHFGLALVPVFWVLFANEYVGNAAKRSARSFFMLAALPAAAIILVMTNGFHGLAGISYRLAEGRDPSFIIAERPWWYGIIFAYLYGLLSYGAFRVLRHVLRGSGESRRQALVIAASVLLPWFANIFMLLRRESYKLDPTPFALSLSGLLFAFVIFKLHLFDLVPIAYRLVVDAIRDGVIVLDVQARFVGANKAAKTIFASLASLAPGSDTTDFFNSIPFKVGDRQESVELSVLVDNSVRHLRIDTTLIKNGKGERLGLAVIVADTTQSTELLSKLARLATTDDLTGANNRRHFFELADREMYMARRNDRPIAFAMFDLDHFKLINDRYGHPVGDIVLTRVCDECRSVLRSSDILCRYGGEEFVILFPEATTVDAMEIAERLRLIIAEASIPMENGFFNVTASFGVTGSVSGPREELDVYLKRIDDAMYKAKEAGRNRVEIAAPV